MAHNEAKLEGALSTNLQQIQLTKKFKVEAVHREAEERDTANAAPYDLPRRQTIAPTCR